MDSIDQSLINEIQDRFPIHSRPFAEIGKRLGIEEADVLRRLGYLMETGVIRRIGAVFSAEHAGLFSTLVALRIDDVDYLDEIAQAINAFPEVTHNYQRNHFYNIWFTVTAQNEKRAKQIIETVAGIPGISEVAEFPQVKTYKIDARFRIHES